MKRRIPTSALEFLLPLLLAVIAVPHSQAQQAESNPAPLPSSFEVASIKVENEPGTSIIGGDPGTYIATRIPAEFLIMNAYNVTPFEIAGEPKWVESQRFDVEAKADETTRQTMKAMAPAERSAQTRLMLRSLLADRFKLVAHHVTTEMSVFSLVVSEPGKIPLSHGSCVTQSDSAPTPPGPPQPGKWPDAPCGGAFDYWGHIAGRNLSIAQLVNGLSAVSGKIVRDDTGLTGKYDIVLDWTPDPGQVPPLPQGSPFPQPDPNGPSLQAALEEQLGLKLVSTKGPVETLVIDHIEEPTPN